jgi:predicted porin
MYTTPTFFDALTFSLTDELSEDSGVGTNNSKNDETSFMDRYSASAKYAFGDQGFVGLAADHNIKNADIIRLVGSATIADFTFNAHIQEAEVSDNDLDGDGTKGEIGEGIGGNTGLESSFGNALGNAKLDSTGVSLPATSMYYKDIKSQDAWMVNGKYQLGNWAFKAQYGHSTADSAENSILKTKHSFDADQIALGVDYALSKNTIVYAYGAELDFDSDGVDFVAGNGNGLPTNSDDSDLKTMGVGFETKF